MQRRARPEPRQQIMHHNNGYEADRSSPEHEQDSDWPESDDHVSTEFLLAESLDKNGCTFGPGQSIPSAMLAEIDRLREHCSFVDQVKVHELEAALQLKQEYIQELEERLNTLQLTCEAKNDYINNLEEQLGLHVKDRQLWYQLGATVAAKLDDLGSVLNDAILHGVSNIQLPSPPPTSSDEETEGENDTNRIKVH
ncbi:hypothetical protein PQX77_010509 [Marasmius sp. AFHP31]|nr:hypothetical protein PQX77_010509 [Marasmius sp. AFHP31]